MSIQKACFVIPQHRRALLPRSRLNSALTRSTEYPLTLITAPAGFGKTTLVSTWLRSKVLASGEPTEQTMVAAAWLTLSDEDWEVQRFFKSIAGALETSAVQPSDFAASHPSDSTKGAVNALLQLTGELSQPLILAVDDYQVISDTGIHRAFASFIDQMPPDLHLILISRSIPSLPLARWRAKGLLAEISADELRFTPDELRAFFEETTGIQLSVAQLAQLNQRTEGWIAGLQLLSLALQSRDPGAQAAFIQQFSGENHDIFDYLSEEVMQLQPMYLRDFLMHTSILDQLSASLCDAVTGNSDAQYCLGELARSNAFTSTVEDTQQWYRYHPLFREMLLTHFQHATPDLLPDLHRRASAWYSQNGDLAKAVDHAMKASDFQTVARLLEHRGDQMWTYQEMLQLACWTDALPAGFICVYPKLMLLRAWALLMIGQSLNAEKELNEFIPLLEEQIKHDTNLTGIYQIVRAAVLLRRDPAQALKWYNLAATTLPETIFNWWGALQLGQGFAYAEVGDLLRAEHAFSAGITTNRASGNLYGAMYSIYNLGRTQIAQGALQRAYSTFEYALELARREPEPMQLLVSWAYLGLAEVEYEWNDLSSATRNVLDAVSIGKRRENRETIARGYLLLARIQFVNGESDQALELLHLAENIAHEASFSEVHLTARLWQARLYLALERVDEAERLHALIVLDTNRRSALQTTAIDLLHARILIRRGETAQARQILQPHSIAHVSKQFAIELCILLALCTSDSHQGKALHYLQNALSQSKSEKFRRIFIDEGDMLKTLLTAAARQNIEAVYASTLLTEYNSIPSFDPSAGEQALIEPISPVELEILQLIARGLSNQEIANQRFISLNTVKWHLKNIYGKLGIRSRSAAISRARAFRLL